MKQRLAPAIAALWLTPLPREEFDRRVAASEAELDGPELENLRALILWFQRRYPTPRARLAYSRRSAAALARRQGIANRRGFG